ncbi:DUF250 domain membrane protein [Lineolata rhizophorae]|uniref:DUF250 domain membrane protein n=1 Tax=Lineolata rhizophorae TaxID=578093 RepID=A0A6A6P772_9PEZI|nr:DUF250 domain membrane protein [Lineolata rhizophorae]
MEKERQSGEQPREQALQPPGEQQQTLPTVNPAVQPKPQAEQPLLHPAFYVALWITLSGSVILFNKWVLHTAKFEFPVVLTTWHLAFSTLMTQLMARFTTKLDSRKKVPMTGRVYLRAIVPIGVLFSASLIFSNLTYLYLSVSFIQMLKATTPVATLFAQWSLGLSPPSLSRLGNVSAIVVGVMIASYGEIKFVLIGFIFQMAGVGFEATRLAMVERLLSSAEFKMEPLVSLYYFAPVCAIMNGIVAIFWELPRLTLADIERVGYFTLLANAVVAFMLNIAVVLLIGRTSSLVMTLCGVLKDILLVVASMVIFRDPVSGLQMFGYSIALGGLVYYKLGADKIKGHVAQANMAWADYGARHPALRKVLVFVAVLFVLMLVLGGLHQNLPEDYVRKADEAALERLHRIYGDETPGS